MERVAQIRVTYGDTDRMGVVYYANYLRFFEVGRAEWIRAHGRPYSAFEREGVLLPVIEAHVRYRAPARYDDLIDVVAGPKEVRRASLRFEYRLVRAGEDAPLATGHTMHACIGADGRPRRMPDELIDLLTRSGAS